MITTDLQALTDADAATLAYRKMIAKARSRKWLHIGLMMLWAILALATTAWCLVLVVLHWFVASAYEQLDPHLAKRVRDDRERWCALLRQEIASCNVVERLKREELSRQLLRENPWARYAVSYAASPYIVWLTRSAK